MSKRAIAYRTSIFALVAGGLTLSGGGAAQAQTQVSQVTVTAQPGTAAAAAPSQAPVDAVQPTSVVTSDYIANDLPATTNYDEIIAITPSVSAIAPNGPGLMEGQFLTIRGFQDGQYNVTIDGIAWGDSNDFTHHTTSYVTGHDLGSVSVDRGPGTASTLGDATFGGTVAMATKDPTDRAGLEAYGAIGSWSTYVGGVRDRQRQAGRAERRQVHARRRARRERRRPERHGPEPHQPVHQDGGPALGEHDPHLRGDVQPDPTVCRARRHRGGNQGTTATITA